MSRESLLDEAIAKAKKAEDWQLVEWLRMARGGESASRWYTAKLDEARLDMSKLMTENAKLRELVGERADDVRVLTELEAENAKLRELMKDALIYLSAWMGHGHPEWMVEKAHDLGIEVD